MYLTGNLKYNMEGQKHKGVVAVHELSKVLGDRKLPVEVTKSNIRNPSLMAVHAGQTLPG